MQIDINADLGEGAPHDAAILPHITSASIACGRHAGDADTMRRTIEAAAAAGVAVGAHPGFADRAHFGRRELPITPDEAYTMVTMQVCEFRDAAAALRVPMVHVKPHGALYTMAARGRDLANAIARAVRDTDPELALMGLAGSALVAAGIAHGLRTLAEAFPDRGYAPDGTLLPRSSAGAIVSDPATAATRAVEMAQRGGIDTLCIHGDAHGAPEIARAVRDALEAAGFAVTAGAAR
ncbi:MAG: LamB/YcsF family protein [Gemmatimonadaceae bacterium]|nr:LamB/YcsF family protein [Gemmatimonadaceae bacterium]